MEFPVVSTRGSLSHSISRRACLSLHIICEVWVCGLPMLARQPWTGGDEQSAPFRHHTQFRQTLADLCPSFFCFLCWRELTQKIEKSGSDTRLGYVSVPLDDIISPAISLALLFDWPCLDRETAHNWSNTQAGSPAVLTTGPGNSQFLGCRQSSQILNDPSIPWATKLGNIWRYLKIRLAYRCEPLLGAKGELVGA